MPSIPPKQIVKLTLRAIRRKEPESQILRSVIEVGIDPRRASGTVESIREGFKAGVQSAVMGTPIHAGANDLYLIAFEQGRRAMRFTSPAWVLIRLVLPILVGIAVILYLAWCFMS